MQRAVMLDAAYNSNRGCLIGAVQRDTNTDKVKLLRLVWWQTVAYLHSRHAATLAFNWICVLGHLTVQH